MSTFTASQTLKFVRHQLIEDAILSQSFQAGAMGKATGNILATLAGSKVSAREFFAIIHELEDDAEITVDSDGCVHRIVRYGM